mgnify:FL=1
MDEGNPKLAGLYDGSSKITHNFNYGITRVIGSNPNNDQVRFTINVYLTLAVYDPVLNVYKPEEPIGNKVEVYNKTENVSTLNDSTASFNKTSIEYFLSGIRSKTLSAGDLLIAYVELNVIASSNTVQGFSLI